MLLDDVEDNFQVKAMPLWDAVGSICLSKLLKYPVSDVT